LTLRGGVIEIGDIGNHNRLVIFLRGRGLIPCRRSLVHCSSKCFESFFNLPSRLCTVAALAVTSPGCPDVMEEASRKELVDLLRFWKTICISVDAGGGSGTLVFYTQRPMSGWLRDRSNRGNVSFQEQSVRKTRHCPTQSLSLRACNTSETVTMNSLSPGLSRGLHCFRDISRRRLRLTDICEFLRIKLSI